MYDLTSEVTNESLIKQADHVFKDRVKVTYVDDRKNHGTRYLGFLIFDTLELRYTTYNMYNHKNLRYTNSLTSSQNVTESSRQCTFCFEDKTVEIKQDFIDHNNSDQTRLHWPEQFRPRGAKNWLNKNPFVCDLQDPIYTGHGFQIGSIFSRLSYLPLSLSHTHPPSLPPSLSPIISTTPFAMNPMDPWSKRTVIEWFSRLTLFETVYMNMWSSSFFDTRPTKGDPVFVFICIIPSSDTDGFFSIHLHHFSFLSWFPTDTLVVVGSSVKIPIKRVLYKSPSKCGCCLNYSESSVVSTSTRWDWSMFRVSHR